MDKNINAKWFGEIPNRWNCIRIADVYVQRNIKVKDTEFEPLSVTKSGVVKQISTVVKASEGSDRKLVEVGDFVINSRSDRKGSCGISEYIGSCSTINTVIYKKDKESSKYYDYLLSLNEFSEEFYRWGHGIVSDLWTTRWQEMKQILLPNPPKDEQELIVKAIENKCNDLDLLMNKINFSLIKLKKLRESTIEKYILKGLNHTVDLKYSGYEEIGYIPAHWSMKKTKRIFEIKKIIAGKEGYQVLSITQKGIVTKDISKNEGQMAADYSGYQFVNRGDFAMNHMDLLTGWVDISNYDGVTSPDYRVFNIKDKSKYCDMFYLYLLQFFYFKEAYYSLTQGVSEFGRSRLKADKFLHYEIVCPPYHEQCEIADFLHNKISNIDLLSKKYEVMLDLLKKYKNIIVYEYVTGKKEVI